MFTLSKKFKPIDEYPDDWSVAEAKKDNLPIVLRLRSSLKDALGHPDYPNQIGVAVPLLDPDANGLTTKAEAIILNAIEDSLIRELDSTVFVASITFNGMREFVPYATDWVPEKYDAIVQKINKSFPDYTLQFMMQPDPKWSTFKILSAKK